MEATDGKSAPSRGRVGAKHGRNGLQEPLRAPKWIQTHRQLRDLSAPACAAWGVMPRSDEYTAFEEDEAALRFVAAHPHGATLESIASVLGLTRERVRQIEHSAMAKIRERSPAMLRALLERDPGV